jgi:hypothetical protein
MRVPAMWAGLAVAMFAARSWLYGPGMTASLAALLGLDLADAFGPIGSGRVDLLDPILLGCSLLASAMALRARLMMAS